jgi:Flp pilus assembly CpaF family ATPase
MANYKELTTESERQIRNALRPLMPYFDSPDTNEIMINHAGSVFVESLGKSELLNVTLTDSHILSVIHAIATVNQKDATLVMDARLHGMRVAAAMPPVAVHGPLLAIRKLVTKPQTFDLYLERGDFTPANYSGFGQRDGDVVTEEQLMMEQQAAQGGQALGDLFKWMMRERFNVVVAGGTSSGKTTLGTAFLAAIPDSHRIITCEDTNELVLGQPNVVQLEASVEAGVDLRRLVKMCLRLRPDRIIVGEVRGAELFDLLDAANTGHPGTFFTIHADSAEMALVRMQTLLRMAPETAQMPPTDLRERIAQSVDYIVFQERMGKRRMPSQVIRIGKTLDENGLFKTTKVYDIR